jgi:hypothetical protein
MLKTDALPCGSRRGMFRKRRRAEGARPRCFRAREDEGPEPPARASSDNAAPRKAVKALQLERWGVLPQACQLTVLSYLEISVSVSCGARACAERYRILMEHGLPCSLHAETTWERDLMNSRNRVSCCDIDLRHRLPH